MRARLTMLCLAICALATACLPLTFSHEGSIDFTRYRVVYIQPVATSGSPLDTGYSTGLQRYLADELRVNSGFARITTNPADEYDTVLSVEMYIDRDYDYDSRDEQWDVEASWILRTPTGERVDGGQVSEEASTEDEAAEEAMDAIAYRYLAPYRL